jgi:alkanesulfonate monooxygenase
MINDINPVSIRTTQRHAEISWFDELCGGDTQYLGVMEGERRSNYEHCRDILLEAEKLGYKNILLPSQFNVGQDVLSFASAMAPQTTSINLLTAIRCGELYPPMLARSIATLDHILKGRLTINIINSDFPGKKEDADLRYQRCAETIQILKQAWEKDRIVHDGEIYKNIDLPSDPAKPYQQNGGPLLYFGGISEGARDVCAKYCDVFLMWPETEDLLHETMKDMSARAASYGRTLDFGLRVHVIVRETEAEAKAYSRLLMSKFDEKEGLRIKNRSQDSKSLGVLRQNELRESADQEGFIEPYLWADIGRARSGCGAAIVGDPEQVLQKINRYMDMGFRSFIFSGYPLIEESRLFAKYVLPYLPNISMPVVQQRIPDVTPVTPLTTGPINH